MGYEKLSVVLRSQHDFAGLIGGKSISATQMNTFDKLMREGMRVISPCYFYNPVRMEMTVYIWSSSPLLN